MSRKVIKLTEEQQEAIRVTADLIGSSQLAIDYLTIKLYEANKALWKQLAKWYPTSRPAEFNHDTFEFTYDDEEED